MIERKLIIWKPLTEEPEDKDRLLWFISGKRINSRIRLLTWNQYIIERKPGRRDRYYAWTYPILPDF